MIALKKVMVLLAAYNGMPWIMEQIDTILAQTGVEVELLIRDDGSTDNTVETIRTKYLSLPNVHLIEGTNIGAIRSFMTLGRVAGEADYYAFSDQDDAWEPDKLSTAVSLLSHYEELPAMCHSKPVFMDQERKLLPQQVVAKSNVWPQPSSLLNAITRSCCICCAIVCNRQALNMVNRFSPKDDECVSLESWIPLICHIFGKIVYSEAPLFYHIARPNSNSHPGQRWKSRWYFFSAIWRPDEIYLPHHRYLLRDYKDILPEKDRKTLEVVDRYKKNPKYKLQLLFSREFVAKRFLDTVFIKFLVLISRF